MDSESYDDREAPSSGRTSVSVAHDIVDESEPSIVDANASGLIIEDIGGID